MVGQSDGSVAYLESHSTSQLDDSLACGLSGNTRGFRVDGPLVYSP